MTNTHLAIYSLLLILLQACGKPKSTLDIPEPHKSSYGADSLRITTEQYRDKVLGAIVGSAIGDAMGASTEMWHREDIQRKYGYITGLTPAVRNQSPEGTWEHNLDAGATTDDTRWKTLMVKYFQENYTTLGPESFSQFIISYYRAVTTELGDKEILNDPDVADSKLEKFDWIREWARVALAYQQGPDAYNRAVNRFYGGEMACAGMLYSPMFGLLISSPEEAYKEGYAHSIFDHGYAKDITAMVAAMTEMALQTNSMDSILDTSIFIDPNRYQDSRLLGRISLNLAQDARKSVWASREIRLSDTIPSGVEPTLLVPSGYPGTAEEWAQQSFVYAFLQENKQLIPFHAGEIWQIMIAGLEFGKGDFDKTMQFIINYGRDNDTVGAVAGMILGAKLGFSGLPEGLKNQVLMTNQNELGIDLKALAEELTQLAPPPYNTSTNAAKDSIGQ